MERLKVFLLRRSITIAIIVYILLFHKRGVLIAPLITYNLMHIGTPEILLIAAIVLLLFGGKKIPELMRGLGKGVKSFKDGMKDADESSDSEEKKSNSEVA